MRKNIFYFILFIALAGTTYYFITKDDNTIDGSDANFTVKNTDDITTIFLSSMKGNNIKLSKKNKVWKLNDSMNVNMPMLQNLLQTMHDQKAFQPVPINLHDDAIQELSSNSTKVEVYEDDKKTHTFYVGKNPTMENLTYMLVEGAKRPYIVKFDLQNTFLGARYTTQLSDWMDKHIFLKPEPLEYVKVNYKDSVQHSFIFSVKENDNYLVNGNANVSKPLNKKRANAYVGFFENLSCYGFEQNYLYKDSIIQQGLQLGTIYVKRKNNTEEQATIFFRPVEQDTKNYIILNGIQYDANVFYGLLNQKDFFVIDRETVEKIFRRYIEFFEEDKIQ